MTTGTMVLQQPWQWFERLRALIPGMAITDEHLPRLQQIAQQETAEIDMLFTKLGIDAWVDRRRIVASSTAGFIRYPVLTGGKVSALAGIDRDLCVLLTQLRRQRITTAGVVFPEQWIELPYPLERRPLAWANANLDALRKFQALIGVDHSTGSTTPVMLDYTDDTTSNALLSGTTGSGKSTELAALILSLAYSTSPVEAKLVIVDPKVSKHIAPLGRLPHVTLCHELGDCLNAIASVKAEKDRRKGNSQRQRVFLFVEEFAEIGMDAGKDGKGALVEPLRSLVGTGRELGVHVIACTQKATVDVIDTVLKANLPIRIAGRVTTAKESEVATGRTDTHCERLPGRGSFLFAGSDGTLQRVQGYYLSPDEIAAAVNTIAARWQSVTPYEIEWTATAPTTTATDEIDSHVATVIESVELSDLIDDDGQPKRGAKARIVRAIFGESANTGGANDRIASEVLGRLLNATTTTE